MKKVLTFSIISGLFLSVGCSGGGQRPYGYGANYGSAYSNTNAVNNNVRDLKIGKNQNGDPIFKGLKLGAFQFQLANGTLIDVSKNGGALFVRANQCGAGKATLGIKRIDDDQLKKMTNAILNGKATITSKQQVAANQTQVQAQTQNAQVVAGNVLRANATINGQMQKIEIKEPQASINDEPFDVFNQLAGYACN